MSTGESIINNVQNFINDNEKVKQTMYTSSHFIIATIFVLCLRKYNQLLLLVLLTMLLTYVCYTEETIMPAYVLPLLGLLLYIIDSTVMTIQDDSIHISQKIKNSLWKLPYYGILMYYVIYFKIDSGTQKL